MHPIPLPPDAGCLVRCVGEDGDCALFVARCWSEGKVFRSPVFRHPAALPPPTMQQVCDHLGAHLAAWSVVPLNTHA